MNNSVFHFIIRILSQMNSNSRNALFYWLSEPMRLFVFYYLLRMIRVVYQRFLKQNKSSFEGEGAFMLPKKICGYSLNSSLGGQGHIYASIP